MTMIPTWYMVSAWWMSPGGRGKFSIPGKSGFGMPCALFDHQCQLLNILLLSRWWPSLYPFIIINISTVTWFAPLPTPPSSSPSSPQSSSSLLSHVTWLARGPRGPPGPKKLGFNSWEEGCCCCCASRKPGHFDQIIILKLFWSIFGSAFLIVVDSTTGEILGG